MSSILIVGEATVKQITTVCEESGLKQDSTQVWRVHFSEFFLGTADLIEKYDPEIFQKDLDGRLDMEDVDTDVLAEQHLRSFGGPFSAIILDEYAWQHGRSQGIPVWDHLSPPHYQVVWVAHNDNTVMSAYL